MKYFVKMINKIKLTQIQLIILLVLLFILNKHHFMKIVKDLIKLIMSFVSKKEGWVPEQHVNSDSGICTFTTTKDYEKGIIEKNNFEKKTVDECKSISKTILNNYIDLETITNEIKKISNKNINELTMSDLTPDKSNRDKLTQNEITQDDMKKQNLRQYYQIAFKIEQLIEQSNTCAWYRESSSPLIPDKTITTKKYDGPYLDMDVGHDFFTGLPTGLGVWHSKGAKSGLCRCPHRTKENCLKEIKCRGLTEVKKYNYYYYPECKECAPENMEYNFTKNNRINEFKEANDIYNSVKKPCEGEDREVNNGYIDCIKEKLPGIDVVKYRVCNKNLWGSCIPDGRTAKDYCVTGQLANVPKTVDCPSGNICGIAIIPNNQNTNNRMGIVSGDNNSINDNNNNNDDDPNKKPVQNEKRTLDQVIGNYNIFYIDTTNISEILKNKYPLINIVIDM